MALPPAAARRPNPLSANDVVTVALYLWDEELGERLIAGFDKAHALQRSAGE